MARNLARAGLDVRAWNRTRPRPSRSAADGVRVADTPAEAVRGADVVLTILYDGPAALDTMRQAAAGLRPGAVWAAGDHRRARRRSRRWPRSAASTVWSSSTRPSSAPSSPRRAAS